MQEEELVDRLKEEDEEAFIELVNMYKKKVASLCYSYTEDIHEAEDLSQEVFISVYKNIKTFRKESSFSTYLYRITINKCLSYKRKSNFRDMIVNILMYDKGIEEDMDLKTYVRQEIKKLSKDLKTPLVLYYYVGLS
ncbi:RNA polymerase sigma factor, partial [Clostridium sp.]|uniref:RNA polymerase sigma factor n=1 Tax=Clostridium sp. TaxID=1506 RepID=UPI0034644617